MDNAIYYIAHTARTKLMLEASKHDHNLRRIVGHALCLDYLAAEIANSEDGLDLYSECLDGGECCDEYAALANSGLPYQRHRNDFDSDSESDSDSDSDSDSESDLDSEESDNSDNIDEESLTSEESSETKILGDEDYESTLIEVATDECSDIDYYINKIANRTEIEVREVTGYEYDN